MTGVQTCALPISVIGQVVAGLSAEKTMLADPSRTAESIAALNQAKERLEHLRGPGAKWNVLVGDRVADLSNNVNYQFRATSRNISRMMDERIELLKKGDEWDELTRYIQTVVADAVTQAFVDLEQGRNAVREEVVELDRKSTRLNSSHIPLSRMPSSA